MSNLYGLNIEISDVLIIGKSNTSYLFSKNLVSLSDTIRVVNVIHAKDAITLLLKLEYPVIVLDNDAPDVDSLKLGNMIRENLPLCRIIIIGKKYSVILFKQIINEGAIDVFIPIPIDNFSASTIIAEQQAKYQINSLLKQLVAEKPPKFSPNYYLLHDPSLSISTKKHAEFLGIAINQFSVTIYSNFFTDLFELDEYLIMGYISAISILGQQLFEQKSSFQEINFGGISVIMHKQDDFSFLFFFKNLSKTNYNLIELQLQDTINKLIITLQFDPFNNPMNQFQQEIELTEILWNLKDHKQDTSSYDRKQNIVLFGNQLPKLNEILHRKQQNYNIRRFVNENKLQDYLLKTDVDVIIINQILNKDQWNFTLASQAKDIVPGTQIIALLERLIQPNLIKILNNEYIDYVVSYLDPAEEIEKYIQLAFKRAVQIKSNVIDYHPHNLEYTLHQSVVTREILRKKIESIELSEIPELYGIFILRHDQPFYSKLFPAFEGTALKFDEDLFAGFVASMDMFTDEIFNSDEDFSGFKLGDINLINKKMFEFTLVYFIGNLDHTNFLATDRQLVITSHRIFELICNKMIINSILLKGTIDLKDLIFQIITELKLKFASLNLLY